MKRSLDARQRGQDAQLTYPYAGRGAFHRRRRPEKAEELGVPQALCVADNAGYPIAPRRLKGGKLTSAQIAMNMAFTAGKS